MVFNASLGYDPDEWEECPHKEQFMVFSFFTRLLLSSAAVIFVYIFFRLIENNNSKEDEKDRRKDEARSSTGNIITAASRKLEEFVKSGKKSVDDADYTVAGTAEDLLKEAQDYMQGIKVKVSPPEADMKTKHQFYDDNKKETFAQYIEEPRRRAEEAQRRASPVPEEQFVDVPSKQWGYQPGTSSGVAAGQVPPDQWSQPRTTAQLSKRISREDEEALRQWEMERERLEAERLAKLQDHEVGGDDSELTSSGLLPASHISFQSQATPEGELDKRTQHIQPGNGLERKLMSEIGQIAEASPAVKRESYRDSELTDYDISDFHRDEVGIHQAFDNGTLPAGDVRFMMPERISDHQLQPITESPSPAPVGATARHTTGDSDEYVKVPVDPIYDMPPARGEKGLSPEEARQLQELCQEYDFGIDAPPVTEGTAQSFPIGSQFSPSTQRPQAPPVGPHFQQQLPDAQPTFSQTPQELSPRPHAKGLLDEAEKNVHKINITLLPIPQKDILGDDEGDEPDIHSFRIKGDVHDDPKNIVNAEMFVSDAIEYLGNQQQPHAAAGAFVMEEEMLSSHGSQKRPEGHVHLPSGDPTSYQVKTAEVFERIEHDEHDDITYAPEIQSVEIPPDQMSENSENLQEYFDRAAAEGALEAKLRDLKPISAQQAALAQAPHIVSATAHRVNSSSSLASGRSSSDGFPKLRKQTSLLSVMGVTSMQEILLAIDSLDTLSDAMRKAGLENTNMIFGIDYTASNKYQGEDSFGGRSLHTIHPNVMNPYQQVITILGRTLAPFASTGCIPVYGFGDAKTGDSSVFPLKQDGDCESLEEVLKVYNEVTPTVDLSGPTNFAPLIYQAMEICQKANDYHILVIIADGQVTNERATRRAIVQACQYPLSIIVVGVGDGPWDMMKVFDESLPKRPWDNFHFTEFHEIMRRASGQSEGDVKLAVQSLLEIPDQYRCICELGLLKNRSIPPRGTEIRKDMMLTK